MDRRSALKSSAAALGSALLAGKSAETTMGNVNTSSRPSDLKITDLRVAIVVGTPMTCPLIRIATNQGIEGLGEVRDGASATYALILKSRLWVRTRVTSTASSARPSNSAGMPARAAA